MFPRAPVADKPMPKLQMHDHIIMKYQTKYQGIQNIKGKTKIIVKIPTAKIGTKDMTYMT